MMNIPPSEAKALSLEEYEGLLWCWQQAHKSSKDDVEVDAERMVKMVENLRKRPDLLGPRPKKAA